MSDLKIRCSSLGKLMTEPVKIDDALLTPEVSEIVAKKKRSDEEKDLIQSLKDQTLSAGAKTYIREQAAQDIFGVDFEVSGKALEKGIEVEDASIQLLNQVRGLVLVKNTERRTNDWLTGECDLYDAERRRGHDVKSSWSLASFPIAVVDCTDTLYDWQMRGYMMLWDAEEWEVNYCMVNTPDRLIGYEPFSLHVVDHLPPELRVTTWNLQRDRTKEALIQTKVAAARVYYDQVIAEFSRTHTLGQPAPVVSATPAARVSPVATTPAQADSLFADLMAA